MNFETSNLGGILPDDMLAWRLETWSDDVIDLLRQLNIKYCVSPILGVVLGFKYKEKNILISLKCWHLYDKNAKHKLHHARTEFIEFLLVLVKKSKVITTILPQPIAEEIIKQYTFIGQIVEFLTN